MWSKNLHKFKNKLGQRVALSYRPTESKDWKYEDSIYQRIFEVRLETEWGNQFFWYCFSEPEYSSDEICKSFLEGEEAPFEAVKPYLEGDISRGLNLGAVLPKVSMGVLVFGRGK